MDNLNEEFFKLIRLLREYINATIESKYLNPVSKFKGAMTKQPMSEIESQINQLRSEWD